MSCWAVINTSAVDAEPVTVGGLVGGSVGWLVVWCVGGSVGRLVGWWFGALVGRLVGWWFGALVVYCSLFPVETIRIHK